MAGNPWSILNVLGGIFGGSGGSGGGGGKHKHGKKMGKKPATPGAPEQSFKKGGKVKHTGKAKVHSGEVVVSAANVKRIRKALAKHHTGKKVASK